MTDWKQFDRDSRKVGGRLFIWALLAVVGVLVIVAIVAGIRYATAEPRGAASQREKTRADGNYRIAAYDQFYDQCGQVQALEDQLLVMKGDRSLPDDQRSTNVLALTNQRNTLIRQYNADARKTDTRAHFRASDLPYQLDQTQETTTC